MTFKRLRLLLLCCTSLSLALFYNVSGFTPVSVGQTPPPETEEALTEEEKREIEDAVDNLEGFFPPADSEIIIESLPEEIPPTQEEYIPPTQEEYIPPTQEEYIPPTRDLDAGEVPPPLFPPLYPPTFDDNTLPPVGDTPKPFEDTPTNQFKTYRLGVGDGLRIDVPQFPEFSTQALVDFEGNITIPIVGRLNVLGLTIDEVQEKVLYELTTRFLRVEPDVTVSLASPRDLLITLAGEVLTPGYYSLPPGYDVIDAILAAGGGTERADLREIVIRRRLLDGTMIEQSMDVLTPLQQGQAFPNLTLQAGDVVVVTRREIGEELDYDARLAAESNISQEAIVVRVLNYAGGGIGALQLQNGSTFLDAFTQIAPSTDEANLRNIALIRFDPEQGKAITQRIDGKRALLGDISQDVPLKNNDVLVVGRSLIAKLTYALNIFTRPFRDVLGFLLFFQQLESGVDSLFGPGGTTTE